MRKLSTYFLALVFLALVNSAPLVIEKCRRCTITSGVSTCSACLAGYAPNTDKLTCVVSANCDGSWDSTTSKCAGCADGYYLTAATGVCTAPTTLITNCKKYSTATTCSQCSDGYYPNAAYTSCTAGTGCKPTSAECASCAVGYYLSAAATCSVMANCKSSNTAAPFACTQCSNGYYWNGSACTALAGCSYSASNKCSRCNYYEVDATTGEATGTQVGGYVSDATAGTCTATTTVANCYEYNTGATACTECKLGYYLASATSCTTLAKCYQTTSSVCSGCYPLTYNFDGTACT